MDIPYEVRDSSLSMRIPLSRLIQDGQIAELRSDLYQLAHHHRKTEVIIDFETVDYVSSNGVGALVDLHQRLSTSRMKTKFVNVQPDVLDIFISLRIDSIIEIQTLDQQTKPQPHENAEGLDELLSDAPAQLDIGFGGESAFASTVAGTIDEETETPDETQTVKRDTMFVRCQDLHVQLGGNTKRPRVHDIRLNLTDAEAIDFARVLLVASNRFDEIEVTFRRRKSVQSGTGTAKYAARICESP